MDHIQCPDATWQFHAASNKCFKLFVEAGAQSWFDCQGRICRDSANSTLATVTRENFRFVATLLAGDAEEKNPMMARMAWLGLYRGIFPDEWWWVAGEGANPGIVGRDAHGGGSAVRATWTRWVKSYPRDIEGRNCALMCASPICKMKGLLDTNALGSWFNMRCSESEFHYMVELSCFCEYPSVPHDQFLQDRAALLARDVDDPDMVARFLIHHVIGVLEIAFGVFLAILFCVAVGVPVVRRMAAGRIFSERVGHANTHTETRSVRGRRAPNKGADGTQQVLPESRYIVDQPPAQGNEKMLTGEDSRPKDLEHGHQALRVKGMVGIHDDGCDARHLPGVIGVSSSFRVHQLFPFLRATSVFPLCLVIFSSEHLESPTPSSSRIIDDHARESHVSFRCLRYAYRCFLVTYVFAWAIIFRSYMMENHPVLAHSMVGYICLLALNALICHVFSASLFTMNADHIETLITPLYVNPDLHRDWMDHESNTVWPRVFQRIRRKWVVSTLCVSLFMYVGGPPNNLGKFNIICALLQTCLGVLLLGIMTTGHVRWIELIHDEVSATLNLNMHKTSPRVREKETTQIADPNAVNSALQRLVFAHAKLMSRTKSTSSTMITSILFFAIWSLLAWLVFLVVDLGLIAVLGFALHFLLLLLLLRVLAKPGDEYDRLLLHLRSAQLELVYEEENATVSSTLTDNIRGEEKGILTRRSGNVDSSRSPNVIGNIDVGQVYRQELYRMKTLIEYFHDENVIQQHCWVLFGTVIRSDTVKRTVGLIFVSLLLALFPLASASLM